MLGRMPSREYRLTLEGELSDRSATAFEGLTLTRDRGTTVLRGMVRDQAELQGVLQRVMDLGLTLVSATSVRDATEDRAVASAEIEPPPFVFIWVKPGVFLVLGSSGA